MSETAVGFILNGLGRATIPTRDEVIHLSRLIQAGLAEGATPRQQRAGNRARQRLVQGNARLAVNIAKGMSRRIQCSGGLDLEDLMQEAFLGLDTAARKYDPERGFAFSTYATWWIRQATSRAIELQAKTVRIPNGALTLARRWRYRPEGQSLEAFAEAWDLKPEVVVSTLRPVALTDCRSIDAQVRSDDGDGSCLLDLIAADAPDPLAGTDEAMAIEALAAALPDDLAVVQLQVIEGARQSDLAELLDLKRSTIGKELMRAKERLAEAAGDQVRALVASAPPVTDPAAPLISVDPLPPPAAEAEPEVQPQLPTLQQRIEAAWIKHQRERRRERRAVAA